MKNLLTLIDKAERMQVLNRNYRGASILSSYKHRLKRNGGITFRQFRFIVDCAIGDKYVNLGGNPFKKYGSRAYYVQLSYNKETK